ncbi:MAG: hypothetical protein P8Y47_11335, partial [Alphaproteobacteria bacterium]
MHASYPSDFPYVATRVAAAGGELILSWLQGFTLAKWFVFLFEFLENWHAPFVCVGMDWKTLRVNIFFALMRSSNSQPRVLHFCVGRSCREELGPPKQGAHEKRKNKVASTKYRSIRKDYEQHWYTPLTSKPENRLDGGGSLLSASRV